MGKTKITVNLSEESIRKAIQELEQYKQDLNRKIEVFTEKLAQVGEKVALQNIKESPLGKTATLRTEEKNTDGVSRVVLIATGEIKQSKDYPPFNTLLAIEFGAGIHYNKAPNPNADKFGLGVGTFPGQIHAYEDYWFYWDEKQQKWLPTHGVKATMPMYKASVEIIESVKDVAKEVFG